jgi:hypothetical protein
VKTFKLEQVSTSPDMKFFLAIFYDENKSMSGIKFVKLYRSDSLSVDEAYYGAHPLELNNWTDSEIIFDAGVFSAHGDSVYRKQYLNNSIDSDSTLGIYKIKYNKNYNFKTE